MLHISFSSFYCRQIDQHKQNENAVTRCPFDVSLVKVPKFLLVLKVVECKWKFFEKASEEDEDIKVN